MQNELAQRDRELEGLHARMDRQRSVRANLESHLKSLFRDYKAVQRLAAEKSEEAAQLAQEHNVLTKQCDASK